MRRRIIFLFLLLLLELCFLAEYVYWATFLRRVRPRTLAPMFRICIFGTLEQLFTYFSCIVFTQNARSSTNAFRIRLEEFPSVALVLKFGRIMIEKPLNFISNGMNELHIFIPVICTRPCTCSKIHTTSSATNAFRLLVLAFRS